MEPERCETMLTSRGAYGLHCQNKAVVWLEYPGRERLRWQLRRWGNRRKVCRLHAPGWKQGGWEEVT